MNQKSHVPMPVLREELLTFFAEAERAVPAFVLPSYAERAWRLQAEAERCLEQSTRLFPF